MSGLDKTGPMGQGSQTGRKQGKCDAESETIAEKLPRGRRFAQGFRTRFGLGNEQSIERGKERGMGRGQGKGMGRGRR